MTKAALLVGCDYTGTSAQLSRGCIDDVQNIYQVLTRVYGYLPQNIVVLRDDDPKNLPTKANILAKLQALVASSTTMEEIWFHYSGHGTQISQVCANTHRPSMEDAIVPIDVISRSGAINVQNLIMADQLHAYARQVAASCRAIWLFDSCHSGTICELPYKFDFTNRALALTSSSSLAIPCQQFYMMSGCTDLGTSANIYLQVMNEYVGAFTTILILTLQMYNYAVDIKTLYEEVCLELTQNGFSQHPWLSCGNASPNFTLRPAISGGTLPTIIPMRLTPIPIPATVPIVPVPSVPLSTRRRVPPRPRRRRRQHVRMVITHSTSVYPSVGVGHENVVFSLNR